MLVQVPPLCLDYVCLFLMLDFSVVSITAPELVLQIPFMSGLCMT